MFRRAIERVQNSRSYTTVDVVAVEHAGNYFCYFGEVKDIIIPKVSLVCRSTTVATNPEKMMFRMIEQI